MEKQEFQVAYKNALVRMLSYTPKQVGGLIWAERAAALYDEHQDWAEELEDSL